MNSNEVRLKKKRQQFHRQLLSLGEDKYKEVIVEGTFAGIESTKDLNELQLDQLIADAQTRMGKRGEIVTRRPMAFANAPEEVEIRKQRNRCLQVLSERGIKSTPKDWSEVNNELAEPRYQWILSDTQRTQGVINRRGIGTFNTVESLRKLFYQLCAIRDNEAAIKHKILHKASQN